MQAKSIRIHSVKVLGCDGSGTLYDLAQGLLWVEANLQQPTVINLSLEYTVYDPSIASILQSLFSLAFVCAAGGNDGADACNAYPGSEPGLAGVGATTIDDQRASKRSSINLRLLLQYLQQKNLQMQTTCRDSCWSRNQMSRGTTWQVSWWPSDV